jgi:hypothetical protein
MPQAGFARAGRGPSPAREGTLGRRIKSSAVHSGVSGRFPEDEKNVYAIVPMSHVRLIALAEPLSWV